MTPASYESLLATLRLALGMPAECSENEVALRLQCGDLAPLCERWRALSPDAREMVFPSGYSSAQQMFGMPGALTGPQALLCLGAALAIAARYERDAAESARILNLLGKAGI